MAISMRKKREEERFEKKQKRVQSKLERQEGRVAKTMAKRDVKRIKKGKDVEGKWVDIGPTKRRGEKKERQTKRFYVATAEDRMRKPGALEFKKKRLSKLRKKNVALSREDEYKQARKRGDWSGKRMAERREFKEQDASAERLKEKKKAYRKKKGYASAPYIKSNGRP